MELQKVSLLEMRCSNDLFVFEDTEIDPLLNSMSEFPGDRKNMIGNDVPPDGEEDSHDSSEPSSSSSSFPCSSQDLEEHIKEKSSAVNLISAVDHGDDDGYHTPTSPRSRIPPPSVCPPAPKKPKMRLRGKRKRETNAAAAAFAVGDCGCPLTCFLPFVNSDLDDLRPKLKKAIEEGINARSV